MERQEKTGTKLSWHLSSKALDTHPNQVVVLTVHCWFSKHPVKNEPYCIPEELALGMQQTDKDGYKFPGH